jgi:ABC-2 type transport system ATP-binding protein
VSFTDLDPTVPAVVTRQLCKQYGDVTALAGLNLNIPRGQFFGLLGRNGSGKTTSLHLLSTLIRPSSGQAQVAGRDVLTDPVEVRRAVGLVFQESALDRNLTVSENLRFAGALYQLSAREVRARMDELLQLFDLSSKRDTPVAALSGGMRRAVDIARGVLHRPEVLLLDEPTTGLDVINRRAVWRFLQNLRKEFGLSLILSTHYLEEAEDCEQVVFMRQGCVIGAGDPAELVNKLGAYILEIRAEDSKRPIEHLRPLLGDPIVEGGTVSFRVHDEEFPIVELQQELRAHARAIQLRRPDLNDVYIWLNHSPKP